MLQEYHQHQQQQTPLAHAKPSGQSQPIGACLPLPTSDAPLSSATHCRRLDIAIGRLHCDDTDGEGEAEISILVDLPGDIAMLRRRAKREHARLITTEKDFVRMSAALREGIDVFRVRMTCDAPDGVSSLALKAVSDFARPERAAHV